MEHETSGGSRGRFGLYTGIVHDNADPEKAGRLRLVIPSIMGTDPFAPWALMGGQHLGVNREPAANGRRRRARGAFHVPAVGSQVLVMFLDGDVHAPVWFPGVWPRDLVPAAAQAGTYPERSVLARGEKLDVVEDRDGNVTVSTERDRMRVSIDTRGGDLELRTDGAGDGVIRMQQGTDRQLAIRSSDGIDCGTLAVTIGAGSVTTVIYTPPDGTPTTLTAVPTPVVGKHVGGSLTVQIGD